MGSIVHLSIKNLTIDWGKNYYYKPYSWLFEKKEFVDKYDDYNFLMVGKLFQLLWKMLNSD